MISVIVPVYKVEPYLHKCIDSILAQTYTDFELILIDDGSPDNCGAICDEYARRDARIRVIHQENGGLSAARNAGIDIAKGEYLSFVDSDDMIAKTYLERLVDVLTKEHADISVCGMVNFTDGEEPKLDAGQQYPAEAMTGRDACLSIYKMDGKVWVTAPSKLYNAKLFNNIRFPVGLIHEDQATIPPVIYMAGRVALIKDKLYIYRKRNGSITSWFSTKRFDDCIAVEQCTDFYVNHNDIEMAECASNCKKLLNSKLVVHAYENNMQNQIPSKYKMSLTQALRNIRKSSTEGTYAWHLSLVYPKLVRPYYYMVKIRKMLGINKKTD